MDKRSKTVPKSAFNAAEKLKEEWRNRCECYLRANSEQAIRVKQLEQLVKDKNTIISALLGLINGVM